MGSYRTKEEDVARISTSIYVTNFPESFSAKDLFHTCKVYGHVVDSFIPRKRSNDGNRFGFVRFINVFNVERLVRNLCTIWVGSLKLQANVSRFQRSAKLNNEDTGKQDSEENRGRKPVRTEIRNGLNGIGNSFVNVVKGTKTANVVEDMTAIVLDESCYNTKELGVSLIARMNEFSAISNLNKVLQDE
ncbi:nucleotide-binding alpha-beta plait domain-containing protein, partial [Tanacetum coccineum]